MFKYIDAPKKQAPVIGQLVIHGELGEVIKLLVLGLGIEPQFFAHFPLERHLCSLAKLDSPPRKHPKLGIIHPVKQEMLFVVRYSDGSVGESSVGSLKVNHSSLLVLS